MLFKIVWDDPFNHFFFDEKMHSYYEDEDKAVIGDGLDYTAWSHHDIQIEHENG